MNCIHFCKSEQGSTDTFHLHDYHNNIKVSSYDTSILSPGCCCNCSWSFPSDENTPRAKATSCSACKKVTANTSPEYTALPDYIIYYMATMKMQSFPCGSPSAFQSQQATAVSFIPVLWPVGCPVEWLKRQKYKSTARDARIHNAGHFAGHEGRRSMQRCLTSDLLFCKLISL